LRRQPFQAIDGARRFADGGVAFFGHSGDALNVAGDLGAGGALFARGLRDIDDRGDNPARTASVLA